MRNSTDDKAPDVLDGKNSGNSLGDALLRSIAYQSDINLA
jgi:hypothetical protein